MAYGFATFEKAKEIFSAVRKISWFAIPVIGPILWLTWVLLDYLPARAIMLLDWIAAKVPKITVSLASVGIDWPRINQWVPLNEAFTMAAVWVALAGVLLFWRMMKKLLPFS